jgi:hypothetical protein
MPDASTFFELARALAEAGAAESCLVQATALEARATVEPSHRAGPLRSGARGLRVAARILQQVARCDGIGPFHPVGIRGALAAGHLALAEGRAAQAELVGEGIAEAAPRCAAGLRLVGQALFAQGKFHPAVRAFRGALAADANDPFTRALHAEALWFAGERLAARCAVAMLRSARKVDPFGEALEAAIRCGALEAAGRKP